MNILIVEDEPVLQEGLTDLLRGAGHQVEVAGDGLTAVQRGLDPAWELILLDIMLPKLDGIEACRRIRKARPAVPILMLTAKGSEDEKVRGLSAGADDYVTKPFGARELLARVETIARRLKAVPAEPEIIEADGCRFDLGRCLARRGKQAIELTPRETGILRWLHQHRVRVVSRAELLENVWAAQPGMETRTVDVTLANLRHKIERNPAAPRIIVSVKGVGYAWGEP